MKLSSYSYFGRIFSTFFLLLLSVGCGAPDTTYEQAWRDTRAQVEENIRKADEKFRKDGEELIRRTSGNSSSSHEGPTLEIIVARAREDASRNWNRNRNRTRTGEVPKSSKTPIFRPPVEKSLDQFAKAKLEKLRKVVQDEKSSPFDLNESIWDLQSKSIYLRRSMASNKHEQASYLRDQIRPYVDKHGVMTRAYPEIVIPKGYLHTSEYSEEGLFIRKTLNDAMASEAIILSACSSDSGASGECEAFQAWSEELNSAFFIADHLYRIRQINQFYSLMGTLYYSTEFIKGFAKGVLDGSINAVVALPKIILHLPELSEAIYEALSDMPETYEEVKEIAQAQYERILQADARELGEIAGELSSAVGSTFVAPGVVLRAIRASGPIVKALGKMSVRAALERGTEVALEEGLIEAKYVAPFNSLSKELPEVAKGIAQTEGSMSAAAEKIGDFAAKAGLQPGEKTKKFFEYLKDLVKNESGNLDLGKVAEFLGSQAGKIVAESPFNLRTTYELTKSKGKFVALKNQITSDGHIRETIKYVEHKGEKFIVDGHHRVRAAMELGIKEVAVEKVELPYKAYQTAEDLRKWWHMVTWQFQVNLIPTELLTQIFGHVPLKVSEEMINNLPDWDDSSYKAQEREILSKYLAQKKSWSANIDLWGTEESHCVELIYDSNLLTGISIRLDLRDFDRNLVSMIEELGRLFNAVGVSEDGEIFQLQKENLKTEIQQSQAFRFVKDPISFLDEISKRE